MKSRIPEKDNNKVSYGALLAPRVKPIVIIGMVLAIFQQWCGINVIFNYAQEIFASAGFDINSTLKSIVATGVVNLVFTIAALPLVDKIGRRKLMLLGASGLTLIYVLIAGAYAMGIMGWPVLLLVLAAIAIYALTTAPVTGCCWRRFSQPRTWTRDVFRYHGAVDRLFPVNLYFPAA